MKEREQEPISHCHYSANEDYLVAHLLDASSSASLIEISERQVSVWAEEMVQALTGYGAHPCCEAGQEPAL
jgi:hypothetical protein